MSFLLRNTTGTMSKNSLMTLFGLIFQIVLSNCALHSLLVTSSFPVDKLHSATTCLAGTVTRVVQSCDGPLCPPKSVCLPCVPKGVDDVCRAKDMAYSVLVGTDTHHRKLTERTCDPRHFHEDLGCPDGSVCIDNGSGRGICCYTPDHILAATHIPSKEPRCPEENPCGRCPPGLQCAKVEVECQHQPCPHSYSCSPDMKLKPGKCPANPTSTPPPYCLHRVPRRLCLNDSQCPHNFKCCRPTCGGKTCMKAILDPYRDDS